MRQCRPCHPQRSADETTVSAARRRPLLTNTLSDKPVWLQFPSASSEYSGVVSHLAISTHTGTVISQAASLVEKSICLLCIAIKGNFVCVGQKENL